MKILHTADWHIGKRLHKHSLSEDFDMFLNWLTNLILEREVDVLLISGDIFDLANPSSESRKQYYRSLNQLRSLNCKIILTGGNHDSPAMLDAPQELLRELDMHIVGGLPEKLEDCILPVHGEDGKPKVVIAALPFLRDSDLRTDAQNHSYEDRLEGIREGITQTFSKAAEICNSKFPGLPAIGMGHLFAAGMQSSESEREIQIGNQAAIDATCFGSYFRYIALGHIHKPQRVNASIPAFYSGSPIPLSFSERTDQKRILLLDTETGWEPESIEIPKFRSLLKIKGNIEKLRNKLQELKEHYELESLVEVELLEKEYDVTKIYDLDALVTNFDIPGYTIVKHRASFEHQLKDSSEIFSTQELEDLTPKEVFQELLGTQYEETARKELLLAFEELLEEAQQN